MTHMVEIRGFVPTADEGITRIDDGDLSANHTMVATPVFENGILIALEFNAISYHMQCHINPKNVEQKFYALVGRKC